jgi:tight adherence protein C
MSGSVVLFGGAGVLGLAIALLLAAFLPGRPGQHGVAHALTAIERRYAQAPAAAAPGADPLGALPGWTGGLAARLSPSGIASSLQRRLDIAGNPRRWTPDRMLAVKGAGLLTLAILGGLCGLRSPGLLILGIAGGGAAGFLLPDLLLFNAGQKRQAKLRQGLPDALDMLTVCVEAGLGFDAALTQVARNAQGPVAAEFARALQEMQIGKTRTQALRSVVDRTTVPELRSFVSALVQASDLGIPIAQVLREQSKEMRVRRRQQAEYRAQQIGVKITFPLILCLFPALIIIVVGPGIIELAGTLFHRLGHPL